MPSSAVRYITVIVPVHPNDLIHRKNQWYTRVLYNAYLPFYYSYILDTHVFPCYNNSYSEIFRLFKESNVDISISKRMNNHKSVSGAAVLSKWGPRSGNFWVACAKHMLRTRRYDDQRAFQEVMARLHNTLSYRQLSSNWFYASHGITERGIFSGPGRCYRSSIVITGPIRWIHGSPTECPLMNGENNELAYTYRAYFICGKCRCNQRGPLVATSANQLKSYVGKPRIPQLLWNKDNYRNSDSLYWY